MGSTATIFTQLFQEKAVAISNDDATLLGMAIYEDTGSFTFDTTTPEDLAAMAWLLAQGANLQTIAQFISQELSAEQVALLHEMISFGYHLHHPGNRHRCRQTFDPRVC